MEIAAQIFGYLGAGVTIALGIPQLVHQLKTKKTGNVNFISFWIFYIGLLLWISLGVWHENPATAISIFISNFGCGVVYTFTMYFLYHYYDKKTKKMMFGAIGGIAGFSFISAILLLLFILRFSYFKENFATLNGYSGIIFPLIVPAFTTLAFFPQFIIGVKNKNFNGITPYMALLFIFNCTLWVLHSVFAILANPDASNGLIGVIVWNVICGIIYAFQFGFIFAYNRRNRLVYDVVN
ncbi:PQ-loop domain-containing transporter [Mycoplasma phocoeninasale]|uniref:PQ-loop repeat-containing protein n=1 Tax=Mycoplasma phocoeninasale TaxID=2726117 RepID=A0A858U171_9MOLU|nr:PQ-loop domain-containing transporter [Mycoplasma phocoeninasale]MBN0970861.1 hypothetical protein [Mycoplasma phocoeninasale]QJG66152.1 hypothetical protein HGG64_00180 [Mycoplasma phocoeninasale]